MFQLFLPLLLLAAAGCALVFWMVGREDKSQREMLSSVGFLGDTTGFLVTTGREGDFPSRPGLDETALKAELDRMVELAAQGRYNAIFFQARPGGMALYQSKYFDPHPDLEGAKGLGAFDPLGYLCDAAGQRQLRVYALLDLSQAPDALTKKAMETQAEISGGGFDLTQPGTAELMARSTAEVGKNYPLGGILLAGLDGLEEEDAREVLTGIRARMTKEGGAAALGLLLDGDRPDDGLGVQGAAALGREGLVGLIMPRITAASTGEDGCASLLARWAREPAGSAKVVPLCPAAPQAPEDTDPLAEAGYRLLLAATQKGISGAVLDHYGLLAEDPARAETLAGFLAEGKGPAPSLDFTVPGELAVTYPAGDVSVTDAAIFLMGTSDPNEPLTLDGEEITRTTTGGSWGALKKLEQGENTFTLRQGERSQTVTVRRYTPGVSTIDGITEGSVFPRYSFGVDSNAKVVLSCMGPAGGSVSATLGGRTISLAQDGSASKNGVPVAFRGTMELDPADYDPNTTTSIGTVTYQLNYNGTASTYQSQGEVVVAGKNVQLVVENTAQLSAVLTDPGDDETITGSLKPGARVYVEETVRTSRSGVITLAYKIKGGGYILAGTPSSGSMAQVVEGAPSVSMEMGEITTSLGEDGSLTVALGEGTPAIVTSRSQEQLILDCYDTTVTGELSQLTNGFVQSATAQEITGGTRLTLKLEPEGDLWGYDLYYRDGKSYLYLKPAPKAGGSYARPLEGVTVLLDPGHGGGDPGAMGVAGETGPAEAQLNLAVSQAAKYRLEQLGAKVMLTRADDSKVSLYERVDISTETRPDIFLSIHHNSGVLTGNMNQARRMECYYFEDISEPFAQALMKGLPEVVGRPGTEPEQARYYVTRQTGNPAVLLEVGFMVNPLEYEECLDRVVILRTACGIAEAVRKTVGG